MSLNFIISMVLSVVICANATSKISLGSPTLLMNRIQLENTALSRQFTFPTLTAGEILVKVEDFHHENGYLSMVGRAQESVNSDFILKGNESNLYGWLVLKEKNIAFEYTTDASGFLIVEQVPVTKIFPVCDVENDAEKTPHFDFPSAPSQAYPITVPHIGPYPASADITKLQSLPGAPKVLYLDMTKILDASGNPTAWTKEEVWIFWQGYAAGVSMYNVNVTTDTAVYRKIGLANSGKLNLQAEAGRSSCGVNAFGTSRGCTVFRKDTPAYNAGTLIHEGGHLLGLSHDGASPNVEYYSGLKAFQWCPIMGSHASALDWKNLLWQYSKGEYSTSNQKQDDFAVIGKHMTLKVDDKVGATPLNFTGASTVSGANNWGQIERNTDSDLFTFAIVAGGGKATIKIDRIEHIAGAMLDVDATLLSGSGTEVAHSNLSVARGASFDQALPAGNYSLVIKGGSEGTPENGFSNYSSVGYYSIDGVITGAIPSGIQGNKQAIQTSSRASFSQGKLLLDVANGLTVQDVWLTSTLGKKVFQSSGLKSFDVSQLPSGIYFLSMKLNGIQVNRTLLKP